MTPAPRTGTEFAGYRIEGLLGRGGMGVVYRAEHPRLGVRIALKLMAPELAKDEGFRERFVREARAAAGVGHPNIVPVYDAGEWQGELYIAMRYIEGEDLGVLVHSGGVLSVPETYAMALQIASALDAAHRERLCGALAGDSASIKKLAAGAVAVITGQQPGLFTGPNYSVLKAATVVKLPFLKKTIAVK